jgi:hypothetical protein
MPDYVVTKGPLRFKQGLKLTLKPEYADFRKDYLEPLGSDHYLLNTDIDFINGEQFGLDTDIEPGLFNQVEEIPAHKPGKKAKGAD